MVRHIVMWKLLPEAEGSDAAGNAAKIKAGLEGLVGVVPGLLSAEVRSGFSEYNLCLESTFESREALAGYADHPAHVAVKTLVHKVVSGRAAFDAEM